MQQDKCLCIKNSGERCTNKSKLPSEFCGIHRNCKQAVKQAVKLPSPVRQPPPVRQPSPVRQPPLPREEICLCINKSLGERCINKSKPPSEFCGIHRNCKQPVKLPSVKLPSPVK